VLRAGADDGIDFPVTELTPSLDGAWPLGNVTLSSEAASLFVSAVAFATLAPLA
jgi:hypothetical protein